MVRRNSAEIEMKKKHIISVIQILAALLMFPLFLTFIPWVTAHPIDKLGTYETMRQEHPAPESAKYFSINHGTPTYYRSSPREQPMRALLQGGALVLCLALVVIPALYYSPNDKTYGNVFSRIRAGQSGGE